MKAPTDVGAFIVASAAHARNVAESVPANSPNRCKNDTTAFPHAVVESSDNGRILPAHSP
jgi:hypothetical protein